MAVKLNGLPPMVAGLLPQKRFLGVFQGIAPNTAPQQTITFDVTAAYNYLDLYLRMANVTIAMIQQIRLKIGSQIIQKWNGTDLNLRLQYDRQPAFTSKGILKLPLRRMALRGGAQFINFNAGAFINGSPRDLGYETSLNCGSAGGGYTAIKDVSIEIDFVNTGAQPTVAVHGRVTSPVEGGPGLVYRVDQQSKTIANGTMTITKAQMGLDALRKYINRIVLVNPDPGNVTFDNFQLRYGTNDWWSPLPANLQQYTEIEDDLHDISILPNQELVVFDFQEEGWGDTMLDMTASNSDILFQFDMQGVTALNNLTYYIETAGDPFSAQG